MKTRARGVTPRAHAGLPGGDDPLVAGSIATGDVRLLDDLVVGGLLLETAEGLEHDAVLDEEAFERLATSIGEPHFQSDFGGSWLDERPEGDAVGELALDFERAVFFLGPFERLERDVLFVPHRWNMGMSQIQEFSRFV